MKNLFPLLVILALVFGATGCKKDSSIKTEYVEGVVTLNGTAIDNALVTFDPVDKTNGVSATGYSDNTGKYTLTAVGGAPQKGAVEGEYKVTVTKVEIKTVTKPPLYPGEEEREETVQTQVLPSNYMKASSTPLAKSVVKGKNTINLELEK